MINIYRRLRWRWWQPKWWEIFFGMFIQTTHRFVNNFVSHIESHKNIYHQYRIFLRNKNSICQRLFFCRFVSDEQIITWIHMPVNMNEFHYTQIEYKDRIRKKTIEKTFIQSWVSIYIYLHFGVRYAYAQKFQHTQITTQ